MYDIYHFYLILVELRDVTSSSEVRSGAELGPGGSSG